MRVVNNSLTFFELIVKSSIGSNPVLFVEKIPMPRMSLQEDEATDEHRAAQKIHREDAKNAKFLIAFLRVFAVKISLTSDSEAA